MPEEFHPGDIALETVRQRLRRSRLWHSQRRGFLDATGLPATLHPAGGSARGGDPVRVENGNRFCRLINGGEVASCAHCQLARMEEGAGTATMGMATCAAGLRHARFPVRFGNRTAAYLVTGQVAPSRPSVESFLIQASRVWVEGSPVGVEELAEAYLLSPVVSEADFDAARARLAAIAALLSADTNRLLVEPDGQERGTAARFGAHDDGGGCRNASPRGRAEAEAASLGEADADRREFRDRRRLERARSRLLASSPPALPEIAEACGYGGEARMRRHFATYFDESPEEHRRRVRESRRILGLEVSSRPSVRDATSSTREASTPARIPVRPGA